MAQPKAVDLGLSVKWASCNVGATSPEEYGSYYAWGETSTKSNFTWSYLKYCTDTTGKHFNKYVTSGESNYWSGSERPDNKRVLDPADDVARAKLGGKWRMPTDAEWTELRTKCTWTWTTQRGVKGYRVTSKINGNSIFLPAAGYRDSTDLYNAGSEGLYWSSELNPIGPYNAWYVYFNSEEVGGYSYGRYYGLSVRPVSE